MNSGEVQSESSTAKNINLQQQTQQHQVAGSSGSSSFDMATGLLLENIWNNPFGCDALKTKINMPSTGNAAGVTCGSDALDLSFHSDDVILNDCNGSSPPTACILQPRKASDAQLSNAADAAEVNAFTAESGDGGNAAAAAAGAPGGSSSSSSEELPMLAKELGVSAEALVRLFRAEAEAEYDQPVWMVVNLQGKIKGSYTAEKMLEFCKRGTLSAAQLVLGIDKDLPYVARQELSLYRTLGQLLVAVHSGARYLPLTEDIFIKIGQQHPAAAAWSPLVPASQARTPQGSPGLTADLACLSLTAAAAAGSSEGEGGSSAAAAAKLRSALQRLCGSQGVRGGSGKQPLWLYINHLGWCRGPFSGGKVMHAHLCGRLPRNTLVAAYDPEVPACMISGDVAQWFRPLGALLDNVANGWTYNPIKWDNFTNQRAPSPSQQKWQPLVYLGTGSPPPLVSVDQLQPPTTAAAAAAAGSGGSSSSSRPGAAAMMPGLSDVAASRHLGAASRVVSDGKILFMPQQQQQQVWQQQQQQQLLMQQQQQLGSPGAYGALGSEMLGRMHSDGIGMQMMMQQQQQQQQAFAQQQQQQQLAAAMLTRSASLGPIDSGSYGGSGSNAVSMADRIMIRNAANSAAAAAAAAGQYSNSMLGGTAMHPLSGSRSALAAAGISVSGPLLSGNVTGTVPWGWQQQQQPAAHALSAEYMHYDGSQGTDQNELLYHMLLQQQQQQQQGGPANNSGSFGSYLPSHSLAACLPLSAAVNIGSSGSSSNALNAAALRAMLANDSYSSSQTPGMGSPLMDTPFAGDGGGSSGANAYMLLQRQQQQQQQFLSMADRAGSGAFSRWSSQ